MTPEEAKALKKGDNIIIHAVMEDVPDDRDLQTIWVEVESNDKASLCVAIEDISVPAPKPKYDLYRRYTQGDIVQLVDFHGRKPQVSVGTKAFVLKDEAVCPDTGACTVDLRIEGQDYYCNVPICFVELVTPVEELEPFYVKEYADFYAVQKDIAHYAYFLKGSYYDDAKKAAQAECDRLNKQHRKENN